MHGRAAIPWSPPSGSVPEEASGRARGAGFAVEALRLISRLQALRDVSRNHPVDFRVLEGACEGSLVLFVGDRLGRTSWTIRLTDPEEADFKAAEEARACADEDWRRAHEAGGGS